MFACVLAHEGGYATPQTIVHGTSDAVYIGAAVVALGAGAAALITQRRRGDGGEVALLEPLAEAA